MRARELLDLGTRELAELVRGGHPIDPRELDDREYRGVSLGLPAFVDRLAWKTFKKVFHRDVDTGALRGWNMRIEQTGLEAPFEPKTKDGAPVTFGHYGVRDLAGVRLPFEIEHGLLIDYGLGGNAFFDPMRRVKDPIVALNAGSADLLLGFSYVDLGGFVLSTPSFFSLERDVALTHVAAPPRPHASRAASLSTNTRPRAG